MVWTSGWKLAVAAANSGVLGCIGAGSMKPDLLREHIRKAHAQTDKPIAVNIPIMRGDSEELARTAIEERIHFVFTSAGHPGKLLAPLKAAGCVVVHVVPSVKHALKAQSEGCDAVVAEGFEAGGHNGMDEITTLCLVPQVVDAVSIPVIAAGGIADGRGILAALALGAEGVQIGTRFAATIESSSNAVYKQLVVDANDADTVLTLKKVAPVRLIRQSPFARRAVEAEQRGATKEEQLMLLGKRRERLGIFEGNLEEGEFEAGQSSGLIKDILPAEEVVKLLIRGYSDALDRVIPLSRGNE